MKSRNLMILVEWGRLFQSLLGISRKTGCIGLQEYCRKLVEKRTGNRWLEVSDRAWIQQMFRESVLIESQFCHLCSSRSFVQKGVCMRCCSYRFLKYQHWTALIFTIIWCMPRDSPVHKTVCNRTVSTTIELRFEAHSNCRNSESVL